MLSDISDGEELRMETAEGAPLRVIIHPDSHILNSLFDVIDTDGTYVRTEISIGHLLNYYNKYVLEYKSVYNGDIWNILYEAESDTPLRVMTKTVDYILDSTEILPVKHSLPDHLKGMHARIAAEIEKWNSIARAHESVKRLEADDGKALARKLRGQENNVAYYQRLLNNSKEKMTAVKELIEKNAADLAAAKELLARHTA
jgi:hypothetical protein